MVMVQLLLTKYGQVEIVELLLMLLVKVKLSRKQRAMQVQLLLVGVIRWRSLYHLRIILQGVLFIITFSTSTTKAQTPTLAAAVINVSAQ